MCTVVNQTTPGFPVLSLPLAAQMGIAMNFVTQQPAIVTGGPISTYSLTQGLVAHYGLGCGQPDYQTMSGPALEAAHSAFVAKFKPAMAQVFGARLSRINISDVNEYEKEGISNIELPDMVDAGLLTFDAARDFGARMARLTGGHVLRTAGERMAVGSPYSLSAMASRLAVYLTVFAFKAGASYGSGDGHFTLNVLGLTGGLVFVGELVSLAISRAFPHMFRLGSVKAALDAHTDAVQSATEIAAGKPAQDGGEDIHG